MKLKILIISFLFLVLNYNSSAQITNDKNSRMNSEVELIIKATQDFQNAWNNGDAKAASQFYTEDAVRVGAFGDVQHGIPEIEAAYEKLLHQTMPGAKVNQERGTVRMLTSDLAIWQGGLEILPPGAATPLKGHVIQVMKKVNNKWMILEAHPKIFPQPK